MCICFIVFLFYHYYYFLWFRWSIVFNVVYFSMEIWKPCKSTSVLLNLLCKSYVLLEIFFVYLFVFMVCRPRACFTGLCCYDWSWVWTGCWVAPICTHQWCHRGQTHPVVSVHIPDQLLFKRQCLLDSLWLLSFQQWRCSQAALFQHLCGWSVDVIKIDMNRLYLFLTSTLRNWNKERKRKMFRGFNQQLPQNSLKCLCVCVCSQWFVCKRFV